MSNVPHLRFPEFDGEWEESTIGEQFDLYSGNTPSRLNKEHFNGSINWISSGELKEHYIKDSKEKISEEAAKNLKMLPKGTFVIAIYGLEAEGVRGTGSILLNNATISQACMAFSHKAEITNEFLYSWYKKHGNVIGIRYAQGTKQQNLSYDILEKFKISYPAIQEQEKLNRFISLLDKRITTQNKIIEDLKKLKSAIRKKVFVSLKEEHTESLEINQLLTYEQPTAYIVTNDEYSTDTTLIPVLTANKGFVLGYTDEDFSIYQKGECIIFDDFTMDAKYVSFPFKVKSSAIKILTAKPNVNLRFMFEYLSYLELKSEEHKRHYISEIASLVVELPSKEMQNKIASLMTSLDNKLALEENTKVKYEDEKQYQLSQMFI